MKYQDKVNQLGYITFAQILGCILVVLGHSYPFVTEIPNTLESIRVIIYSFHMPLFVFCSGFLFAYTQQSERKTLREYVWTRFKKLLIPYLALSLIGIVPKYMFSSVLNDSLQLDFHSLIRALLVPRENIWGHFWFLPMIFFMGIVAYLFEHITKQINNKILIWTTVIIMFIPIGLQYSPISILNWFGINDIIQYGWSYALGVLIANLLKNYKINLNLSWAFSITGSVLLVCIALLIFTHMEGPVVKLFMSIFLIAATLMISIFLSNEINVNRKSLIAQTYQIYILSWPCQLVVEILLERILHLQWWLIMPAVFFTGILMPVIILKLVDFIERKTNTHYLSLIIGK